MITLSVIIAIILCVIIGYALETGRPWDFKSRFQRMMEGEAITIGKEEFFKLPAHQKKMLVARDVILQLNAKKIKGNAGSYIKLGFKNIEARQLRFSDQDIRSNYDQLQDCEVCALGAAIMSCTRLGNKVRFSDVGGGVWDLNNDNVKELLASIFTPKELYMIESAFEGFRVSSQRAAYTLFGFDKYDGLTQEEAQKCSQFRMKHIDDSERLRAIMQNIIDNKGEFVI